MAKREDISLDEALSDPMILAVIRADGADPQALRRDWQPLVERFAARERRDGAGGGEQGASGEGGEGDLTAWRSMLIDCLCASRLPAPSGRAGRSMR